MKDDKKHKKLTKAQEGFVLDVVAGMSYTDAYKNHYKTQNVEQKVINKRASELFKLPHIKAKYNELKKQIEIENNLIKSVVYEKNDAICDLVYLKEKAKESLELDGLKQANSQAFLNAVKELCQLNSLYPKKNDDILGTTENQVADDLLSIMEQVKSMGDIDE